jgi:hypothetical protein
MSEIKHTPGPWGISSESPTIVKQYDFLGETNVIIGSASGYPGSSFFTSDDEAVHNARLIAAAPELLEVLMLVEDRFGAHCIDPLPLDLCERIAAAIAKATGSQL